MLYDGYITGCFCAFINELACGNSIDLTIKWTILNSMSFSAYSLMASYCKCNF